MYPAYYDPNAFACPSGCQFEPEYKGQVLENGEIELIQVGVRDLRALHNRDAQSCDINNIVARFQDGDISALTAVQGSYMDVIGMPKDLRGMSEMIDNLRVSYDGLDDSIKAKFPNFQSWLENVGSPEWDKVMDLYNQKSEAAKTAGGPSPYEAPSHVGDQA